ncbi:ABC transporter substrate-binding protein [Leptospira biflexa]|uniref:heme/hemin ABC transporter substrate-binding protein n=1 Tax=Leptospira biflexa TaxID=172 RepID=UPI001082FAF5|nr:ABC transporter substrate-binding protein [Leptospira biflexa]TGM33964.1 ABC transporter substrate-binding protein [Leptospira biflexa]TGM39484.1 ABC transporter substrate-binding protein [Leptospira biflexa]TGM41747.1 ABC transporter substrate-binding protein [Leptospira biflexa]TGM51941.1 ABC transporter substrate-binding protein [Leptospira biflexa]
MILSLNKETCPYASIFILSLILINLDKESTHSQSWRMIQSQNQRTKISKSRLFLIPFLFVWLVTPLMPETKERIVSLHGTITEIVYALKANPSLVAIDSTSRYPKESTALPVVGYQRTLTTEGILSFKPNIVIGLETAGPIQTLQNLRETGVQVTLFPDEFKLETPIDRVLAVGNLLGKKKEAESLVNQIRTQTQALQLKKTNVKVMFLYSRNPSSVFISGSGTAAHAMITLSGAKNAITEFSEYKPLTSEALVKANPDIILMPESSAEGFGGTKAIWSINGIELTRAGKEKNIILVDDLLLLGFGPRLPHALKTLNEKWKQFE